VLVVEERIATEGEDECSWNVAIDTEGDPKARMVLASEGDCSTSGGDAGGVKIPDIGGEGIGLIGGIGVDLSTSISTSMGFFRRSYPSRYILGT